MLQYGLVKRIERINRLRFLYALHLTLYGVLMVLGVLTVDPTHWQYLMVITVAWLPLLLAHTTAHTVIELRERCTPNQPVPLQAINRYMLPIVLYDEQGNPIVSSDDQQMNYLPR